MGSPARPLASLKALSSLLPSYTSHSSSKSRQKRSQSLAKSCLRLWPPASCLHGQQGPTKLLEARTDGALKLRGGKFHGLPAVLLEVKPGVRLQNQRQIVWQEGAQKAAYVSTLGRSGLPADSPFELLRSDSPNIKR